MNRLTDSQKIYTAAAVVVLIMGIVHVGIWIFFQPAEPPAATANVEAETAGDSGYWNTVSIHPQHQGQCSITYYTYQSDMEIDACQLDGHFRSCMITDAGNTPEAKVVNCTDVAERFSRRERHLIEPQCTQRGQPPGAAASGLTGSSIDSDELAGSASFDFFGTEVAPR